MQVERRGNRRTESRGRTSNRKSGARAVGRQSSRQKESSRTSVPRPRRPSLRSLQLDPSLTLTRTQHPAILGNRGNTKPFTYAVIANRCNAQQPLTAHS